ncbi:uncharacterized protein LOC141529128 isoform X1 [Cotesia typhae]|uniref:uncharacterized protein LOC141529128 isoform X1 n=1 Tax=Cotesia typhae TaxID=2053667 RepID=UPI003D6972B6
MDQFEISYNNPNANITQVFEASAIPTVESDISVKAYHELDSAVSLSLPQTLLAITDTTQPGSSKDTTSLFETYNNTNHSVNPVPILDNSFNLLKYLHNDDYDQNQEPELLKKLKSHPHGLNILNCYKLNKTLTKPTRNLLGRLIIQKEHEGKNSVENLPSGRYQELAKQISELFSSELPNTYFTPHVTIGGGVVQPARGILLSCNNYLRKQYLKQSTSKTVFLETPTDITNNVPSESIQFLKTYIEPWKSVTDHWITSYDERQKELLNCSINSYFIQFPCLKQTNGYTLLELDFDLKYPHKKSALQENWPFVRNQLKHLFTSSRRPSDPDLLALSLQLNSLKDDALDVAILLILSAVFPKPRLIAKQNDLSTSHKRKKSKTTQSTSKVVEKRWNPTKSEAREGFFFQVQASNDLLTSWKRLQNTLETYGLSLQPRPIVVGSIENIISYHLFIDEVQYNFQSSIEVLEVAFKSYYSLNAHYPPEAKAVWQFIELALFKFEEKQKLSVPVAVTSLIEKVLLGSIPGSSAVAGITKINTHDVYAQFIPMRKILKAFFELPNIFERTILYMKYVKENTDCVSNFIQGHLWSEILSKYHHNDLVFPLFIYFDDFESNNCLGSHAGDGGKVGALYVFLPCLPPELYSKLDNIFLFQFFNTLHRKIFGNQRVFQCVIDELNFLANEGIVIETSSGKKRIFFALSLILGDNLGLNSILGYTESFNSSYWCRCCVIDRKNSWTAITESADLIRTKDSCSI